MTRKTKKYSLTSVDIEQIRNWYESAAGESVTGSSDLIMQPRLVKLLAKLGILPTLDDIYCLGGGKRDDTA